MLYSPKNLAESDVLMLFKSPSGLEGVKIHKTAEPSLISAAQHLYAGGFITLVDGGYLTLLWVQAAEHAPALFTMLNSGRNE